MPRSAKEAMESYLKDYPEDEAAKREYLFLGKNRQETETESEPETENVPETEQGTEALQGTEIKTEQETESEQKSEQ